MGLAHERAAVFRVAAQAANFGAKLLDDLLALGRRARGKSRGSAVIDVRGRVLIARDAVDRRRDQRVERADLVVVVGRSCDTPGCEWIADG